MGKLYKADGTIEEVKPKEDRWSLEEFQDLVGGYFEIIPGVKSRIIINDIGKVIGLPINYTVTEIVRKELEGKKLRYQPVIRGDALILDKGEKM